MTIPHIVYCLGAQKAGSTWLAENLRAHPKLHVPTNKEVHYFDYKDESDIHILLEKRWNSAFKQLRAVRDTIGDGPITVKGRGTTIAKIVDQGASLVEAATVLQAFARMFTTPDDHSAYLEYMHLGAKDVDWVCDCSPNYATLPAETLAEMAKLGRTKFIFVMREPVARLWSALRMRARRMSIRNRTPNSMNRDDAAIAELRDWIERRIPHGGAGAGASSEALRLGYKSDYLRTLDNLSAAVPQEDQLILFYEDLKVQETWDRVFSFIGVAPKPVDFETVYNHGHRLEIPEDLDNAVTETLRHIYDGICERFDNVPDAWHRRFKAVAHASAAGS